MKRALLTSALLLCSGTSQLLAQQSNASDGFDFDTLAACSIVYQRIGELYAEQENPQKASEFQDTAYGYSAAGFHTLKYQTSDQAGAYVYAEDRMKMVMESLNASSTSSADGDHAVIEQWLPYCDTLGSGVSELLARREIDGW